MVVAKIQPLDLKIAELLGNDELVAAQPTVSAQSILPKTDFQYSNSPFEDVLNKAVDSLKSVSQSEIHANQMIDKYTKGQADMQDVMVATSKMNIMIQFAVTTVNTAVSTFKEITQMQI